MEKGKRISRDSRLAAFDPFLDERKLIRVGGRLAHADIPEIQKHSIALPNRHHVTKLILEGKHKRLYHCGTEQLLHSIRLRYWVLSGRQEAKKVTRGCLICFRAKPRLSEVKMGDLLAEQVLGSLRPFTNVGVDYARPLQVRESRRRGKTHTSKTWIAVFTCFSTKATHLELVTQLSTEAFLSALRRFISRRGLCKQISSDNGTNFIVVARELKEVYDFLQKEQVAISDHLSQKKIQWKFIPPRSPNFGGLWEATVKAVKRHLCANTKGLVFTFEEYYTLLTEIEAILNSRPLSPMSSDPNDVTALTPAHFLIGDSLLLPIEHSYVETSVNRLSRWQHIQKTRQHFWQRWYREYLPELQRRQKWQIGADNLKVNTLVLIKEDNIAPMHLVLGRVVETIPGPDNIVRVAIVRTASGLYKRAVRKLCPLPEKEDY